MIRLLGNINRSIPINPSITCSQFMNKDYALTLCCVSLKGVQPYNAASYVRGHTPFGCYLFNCESDRAIVSEIVILVPDSQQTQGMPRKAPFLSMRYIECSQLCSQSLLSQCMNGVPT